jgi:acyl carrier protein
MDELLVKQMAEILECDPAGLTADTSFRDHANWSSLTLLSVMAMIDECYQLVIPQGEFERLHTMGELMHYLEQKRS